jgi:ATP-dependent RNA helicase DeaD
MNQQMRDRVMNRFRKSGLEFLVATDVAARGIDVDDVQVVFNYDLPYDVEDYLHRIGRTGRAGRSGRAISFVAGRELFQIQNIERFTKVRIQRGKTPTAGEAQEARAEAFLDKLRATLIQGDFRRQDHFIERLLEEGFSSPDIASALMHHLQTGELTASSIKDREVSRKQPESERPRQERRGKDERTGSRAVKPREARPALRAAEVQPVPSSKKKLKKSRRTPVQQTRLWMNVGEAMGIVPIDVVNAVTAETGLPGKVVGTIDVRERHLFADVSSEHAAAIVASLNRQTLKGHRIKVKPA